MADYRSDSVAFPSPLLTDSFGRVHEYFMNYASSPSAVRVFGKSMHMLAAGWAASVAWLWIAQVQQHMLRWGIAPDYYAVRTLIEGIIPSVLLALVGIAINRWTGRAPNKFLQRHEWWQAFLWCVVPNALLLFTVYVMIVEGR
jgi:hypothetical protein